MPLLIWGWKFIEASSHSQLLLLLWAIVALIIPVVLATTDLRDIARRWRETGFFGSESLPASREASAHLFSRMDTHGGMVRLRRALSRIVENHRDELVSTTA
jgi:hypothetical protein